MSGNESIMARQRLGIISWCVFDWAVSAFSTVVVTFNFAAYFTTEVAQDMVRGTVLWGQALSLAALAVALAGPILGAVADRTGRRKPWLFGFTLAAALLTALLYFVRPSPADIPFALLLVIMASVTSELAMVFYNAMLPAIAPERYLGRISGWAWGLGYAGGLACLLVAFKGLLDPVAPWLDLERGAAEPVRATMILAAIWILAFSVPLFLFTPERPNTGITTGTAIRGGVSALRETARVVWRTRPIRRFLFGFLFYANGLTALFAFGGVYAAGTFGLGMAEMVRFAILLNISAATGAGLFAWLDDRLGPRNTIILALLGLILSGAILTMTRTLQVFWICGFLVGLFVGPAQAAGRSFMARIAPKSMQTAMFGFYALAGKATAFASPLVVSLVTQAFDSQRAGMASILLFFLIGLAFILATEEPLR